MARILVVDDEIGTCELLKEVLEDVGHEVTAVASAQAAREAFRADRPDLVLLDICMPDTDGIALLKEWARAGKIDVPVIMLSGHGTIDAAVEATRIGALEFLEKPIGLKRLLTSVQRALELYPPRVSPLTARDLPKARHRAAETGFFRLPLELPFREAREAFERAYFERLLSEERSSMPHMAQRTGLERTHLYRKFRRLELIYKPKFGK